MVTPINLDDYRLEADEIGAQGLHPHKEHEPPVGSRGNFNLWPAVLELADLDPEGEKESLGVTATRFERLVLQGVISFAPLPANEDQHDYLIDGQQVKVGNRNIEFIVDPNDDGYVIHGDEFEFDHEPVIRAHQRAELAAVICQAVDHVAGRFSPEQLAIRADAYRGEVYRLLLEQGTQLTETQTVAASHGIATLPEELRYSKLP